VRRDAVDAVLFIHLSFSQIKTIASN